MDNDKLYKNVHNYTKFKLVEMLINRLNDGRTKMDDMNSIEDLLKGKRVLITGAGGSIGSELVKQCLNFEPAEVIAVVPNLPSPKFI